MSITVFTVLGLPDVHEMTRRVLAGDVPSVRAAARSATDAANRAHQQADAVAAERARLLAAWAGPAAEQAGRALGDHETKLRAQANQLASGGSALADAGGALARAQAEARLIEAAAVALDRVFTAAVANAAALGPFAVTAAALQATVLAPLRPDAAALLLRMQAVTSGYQETLTRLAGELGGPKGVFRPDAGPADVGDDPRQRQAALFRGVVGTNPTTRQDWSVAAALDPHVGDPAATELASNVVVAKINPVPGAGLVHGDAFISSDHVLGAPPYLWNRGDNRAFDPNVRPDQSRASFLVDYERGLVIVRQNPSHDDRSGVSLNGDPTVGVEQDADGRVRLRLDAANPLAPRQAQELGVSVRSDLLVDPHGGPGGTASMDGRVSQYPSWEVYQTTPDGSTGTLAQRQQNSTEPTGPVLNLPRDTVPVGRHPEALDDWYVRYHPDQRSDAWDDLLPGSPWGDPWFDYPVPAAPYPSATGPSTLRVPNAIQVR